MSKNGNLHAAKAAKSDEFYTQLADVESELAHYPGRFRGAVVYCNCDDPERSNFWRYFHSNFGSLGLRRLVSTHYDAGRSSYKFEYDGGDDEDVAAGTRTELTGDGDFRSPECIEILTECDVVVTNPPFSLFREFVAQLITYGKRFLIIGNVNAVTYKEFFPLIKNDEVWVGPSIRSGDREFGVPDDYPLTAVGWRVDEAGRKYVRVKGVRWFTNLDHERRHEPLALRRAYDSAAYFTYDNCDAINVDKCADIPADYDGVMGVPITFLDKYCPEQFELVRFRYGDDGRDLRYEAGGAMKTPYFRILIKRRSEIGGSS